jgi:hypothetical protein
MGRIMDAIDISSSLRKEMYEVRDWVFASDVNTFVVDNPLPGYDFVPVFDVKWLYPGNQIMVEMVNGKCSIVKVQHVNSQMGVIELQEDLPALPKIGSPIKKVFGDDEKLISERLTENYHKDMKAGRNLDIWLK